MCCSVCCAVLKSVLRFSIVCCSAPSLPMIHTMRSNQVLFCVLQCVAWCVTWCVALFVAVCVAVCVAEFCRVVQRVCCSVWCRVLQRWFVWCSVVHCAMELHFADESYSSFQPSSLLCLAMCYSVCCKCVLQYVLQQHCVCDMGHSPR